MLSCWKKVKPQLELCIKIKKGSRRSPLVVDCCACFLVYELQGSKRKLRPGKVLAAAEGLVAVAFQYMYCNLPTHPSLIDYRQTRLDAGRRLLLCELTEDQQYLYDCIRSAGPMSCSLELFVSHEVMQGTMSAPLKNSPGL